MKAQVTTHVRYAAAAYTIASAQLELVDEAVEVIDGIHGRTSER